MYRLTISLWHSFSLSLSNLVLPHPGPEVDALDIVTYLPQAKAKSSKTCFNLNSTSGSSRSNAALTSSKPSSCKYLLFQPV